MPSINLNVQLPFAKNGIYDDGLGYYKYLQALKSDRSTSDKAMDIRRALENLVYVYYTREHLLWPESLQYLDTLANRINYLTRIGVLTRSRTILKAAPIHFIPPEIFEYDKNIQNSFKTISRIVNPPIHSGDDNILTDVELESALTLLEKFITWYFTKYEIDIQNFELTVKRLYSPKVKKVSRDDIYLLDTTYWIHLLESCSRDVNAILQNFYLRADETLTQEVIVIEKFGSQKNPGMFLDKVIEVHHKAFKTRRVEKIGQLVGKCLLTKCSTLIKIFAPSGDGKTVFLNQVAFEYSLLPEKCKVYYLATVTKETIEYVRFELDNTSLPLVLIVDTPSKFSEVLNEDFGKISERNYKSLVVIVVEQNSRYNKYFTGKPWETKLENYFSEVYQIDFELQPDENENIFQKILNTIKLSQNLIPEKEVTIKAMFYDNPQSTIREKIYQITKFLDATITTKHKQDWDVWDQITNDESTKKFKDLFPFVALFSYFEMSVPISLFNYDYLTGINETDVEYFIRGQSRSSILKIIAGQLELRHEQISKWYFDIPEHVKKGTNILHEFIYKFRNHLDPMGCYLFRNIHVLLQGDIFGGIDPAERKNILKKFFDKVGFMDQATPKVLIELAKLEVTHIEKINWLDKIIQHNSKDVHARTFKVQLLLDKGAHDQAQEILDDLFVISENASWNLNNQYRLDKEAGHPIIAEKYIALGKDKKDMYIALYQVAKKMQYTEHSVAFDILKYLKMLEPQNPLAPMVIAHMYRRKMTTEGNELAIEELSFILKNNIKDVPARLLLADLYCFLNNISKAESILVDGIKLNPDQPALYVKLIKLYREKKDLIKNTVEKTGDILRQCLQDQSFGLKIQIRTEYAKWCHENFNSREQHETAITILNDTIKLYPFHLYSRTELGIIYQKSIYFKDLNKSVAVLREAVALDIKKKQVPCRVVLAHTLMLLNTDVSWQEARQLLEEAKLINPKNIQTYFELIKIYKHFNDIAYLNEAIHAIEQHTKKDDRFITFHCQRLLKNGKSGEALSLLEKNLENNEDNFYFLNQVASILLELASKNILAKDDGQGMRRNNELLFHAERYLLQSLAVLPDNQSTIFLLISVYNNLRFTRQGNEDIEEYLNALKKRNERIQELFNLNEYNLYLNLCFGKTFTFYWKPRLAIYFLEKCISRANLPKDKLKLLNLLKEAYKIFNCVGRIKKIESEVSKLLKDINSDDEFNKLAESFKRYIFIKRENYHLVNIYNTGNINSSFKSITTDKGIIPILQSDAKINRQVKANDKVYFATYLVDNNLYANNLEPFFKDISSLNLLDILPNKLRL